MNSQLKILFILLNKLLINNMGSLGSLDVDSLFTNIPLEETIEICTNELFKVFETVEGLSKTELLSVANKSMVWLWVPPRPYVS